jgi:AraC family transcriptional regulator, arabinose operon regulatory protein
MRGFGHIFAVPPLRSATLTLHGLGVQEHMPPCAIDRPHGTDGWLFMLFYDPVAIGAGRAPAACPADTLMLWAPGRPQYYGNLTHRFTHTWVLCDGTLIRKLIRVNRLPVGQPIACADPTLIERCLLAVHAEISRPDRPDPIIVGNLLENFLRETARSLRTASGPPTPPHELLEARHYLESQYDQPITLQTLAARAHLSVSHFSCLFHHHFGAPPIDYLIRHRLHQAAYLLRDRNLKVSEVARRVGYHDLYHFSRIFKKHFGLSPRAMRKGLGNLKVTPNIAGRTRR